jgi:hypothetical protein
VQDKIIIILKYFFRGCGFGAGYGLDPDPGAAKRKKFSFLKISV